MGTRKTTLAVFGLAAMLLVSTAAANATQWYATHWYTLNGTYNDLLGGPAITPLGGDLTSVPGWYNYGANEGLWLPQSAFNPSTWIIETSVVFTAENNSWKKIADFSGLASDDGFYFGPGGDLQMWDVSFGPTGQFQTGTIFTIDLTRDGTTGVVTGYLNGVPQFSFVDSSNEYVINSNGVYLFVDDFATGQREAVPGLVDYVAIGTTPEPGTFLMLGSGVLGLAGMIRRKLV